VPDAEQEHEDGDEHQVTPLELSAEDGVGIAGGASSRNIS